MRISRYKLELKSSVQFGGGGGGCIDMFSEFSLYLTIMTL